MRAMGKQGLDYTNTPADSAAPLTVNVPVNVGE
jgi:hypothetical protein